MPAIVNERRVGPVTILELAPRLTLAEGSELHNVVSGLLDSGSQAVLLDCSRVAFIDSLGIGGLVRTWRSVGKRGKLKLFGLPPYLREVLQITGLLKVMDSFDDVGFGASQLLAINPACMEGSPQRTPSRKSKTTRWRA